MGHIYRFLFHINLNVSLSNVMLEIGSVTMWEKEGYLSAPTLILMPALDEEEGIGITIAEFSHYLRNFKVLVVDGRSRDRTVHVAKYNGADVLFQKGRGKGDAIRSAIEYLDDDYKYVVMTDADYTYPAGFVPQMLKILEENPEVGMVCGNRFNSHFHMEAMRNLYYIGNRAIAFTHNLFNGIALRDPLTGLRALRWKIIKNWVPKSKGFDIEVELNHHIERNGYGIVEIEIPYRSRVGEKKLKLKDGFDILKRIVLESTY